MRDGDGSLSFRVRRRCRRRFDVCLERLAILFERFFEIVLRAVSVTDLALRNRQIAQPLIVGRIARDEFFGNRESASIMFERFRNFPAKRNRSPRRFWLTLRSRCEAALVESKRGKFFGERPRASRSFFNAAS